MERMTSCTAALQRVGGLPRLRAIEEIVEAVSSAYGLAPEDILSRSRTKAVAEARICTCFVARRCTRLSYPEIGNALGGRDHTTVMSSIKSAERSMARDAWFAATVRVLLERFGEIQEERTQ